MDIKIMKHVDDRWLKHLKKMIDNGECPELCCQNCPFSACNHITSIFCGGSGTINAGLRVGIDDDKIVANAKYLYNYIKSRIKEVDINEL